MAKNFEKGDETSLGGLDREFPRTTGGFLEGLRRSSGPERQKALEELCRRYWKPVYCFVRLAWAKPNEDAKDLTQAFFAWLLSGEILDRYERERAPFRKFLKAIVRGFMSDHHKSLGRVKRGGDATFVRFEDGDRSLEGLLADPRMEDPERVFDQAWAMSLMRHALNRVKERLASHGRETQYRVFEEHDLAGGAEPPSYADLAARLGLKESQVRDTLVVLRREVREEIRREILAQTESPEAFEEEWNAFLGA